LRLFFIRSTPPRFSRRFVPSSPLSPSSYGPEASGQEDIGSAGAILHLLFFRRQFAESHKISSLWFKVSSLRVQRQNCAPLPLYEKKIIKIKQ
jgi:hypothetical protein